jgi:energy-coupling factor transport system substrate-specific component
MFGCAFVGLLAGALPPLRGRAELVMLAGFGALSGYLFGLLLNLSFWPFSVDATSSLAYRPGAPFWEQLHRYLVFDATTSLGWDTGRAITTFLLVLVAGPPLLVTLRRTARRAAFGTPAEFADPDPERDRTESTTGQ